MFCSIEAESAIQTTKRLFELARIPDRIEVLINFDEEDFDMKSLETAFITELPEYIDNIKIVLSPKGFGYCDCRRMFEEMFDVSTGEFIFEFNDSFESMTPNYDTLIEKYTNKLVFLTVDEITDVDDTRQKWHELFDFPIVHRKWIELTGRFCYTNAPASDLYPILKYYSEIVKPSGIKLVHFPGHEALSNEATEESNVQGMCSLITDESYKYNKKVLHRGKPLYFYEALQEIDIPRVKRFLEMNPEYKV